MNQHLSESEFSAYLLGAASSATLQHLRTCEPCRQEMENFGGALTAFNQASLLYSREHAAARPMNSQAMAAHAPIRTRRAGLLADPATRWGIGVAAAAVLTFAVALPVFLHRSVPSPSMAHNFTVTAPSTAVVSPVPDPDTIQEDNQMMAAIETEISQPDISPLESFTTFHTPVTGHHEEQQTLKKKL
ncbi:MAG TPA: hypothetical protein VGB94_13175 [Acidobacteriaceae bacterium]